MPDKPQDQHSHIDHNEDPLWNLLGKASTTEPSPFFARNVIRETRQESPLFTEKLKAIFSARKLAFGAVAACACLLVVSQINLGQGSGKLTENHSLPPIAPSAETIEISEFIIQETLLAAAEDPSIFTHDEVLAMVGF